MHDIKKLAINRAESQPSNWPHFLSELKFPLIFIGEWPKEHQPTQVSQFQGTRAAQEEPRFVGGWPAYRGMMLGSLDGKLEGAKVTQDLVRVYLAFQSHWGKANVDILEGRLLQADWYRHWPIRMEEAGHNGSPWQQIFTNQWRNVSVF